MEYAQLNEAGTSAVQIISNYNIEWDANNYCSVEKLVEDGKSADFRIVPLIPIGPPSFNPVVQYCFRDGCEYVDGTWKYKWTILDYSQEQATINQATIDKLLYDRIVVQTQHRLDSFAQLRGYDNILSACTYATSAVPKFQQEGQYCVNARDITWAKLLEILAEVQAGTRPKPAGYMDIEPELPLLVWPA